MQRQFCCHMFLSTVANNDNRHRIGATVLVISISGNSLLLFSFCCMKFKATIIILWLQWKKILTQANRPSLRANIRMPNLGNKSHFRRCKRILRINHNIHIKNTIFIRRTRRTGYCSDEMSPSAFITGKISIVGGQYG